MRLSPATASGSRRARRNAGRCGDGRAAGRAAGTPRRRGRRAGTTRSTTLQTSPAATLSAAATATSITTRLPSWSSRWPGRTRGLPVRSTTRRFWLLHAGTRWPLAECGGTAWQQARLRGSTTPSLQRRAADGLLQRPAGRRRGRPRPPARRAAVLARRRRALGGRLHRARRRDHRPRASPHPRAGAAGLDRVDSRGAPGSSPSARRRSMTRRGAAPSHRVDGRDPGGRGSDRCGAGDRQALGAVRLLSSAP